MNGVITDHRILRGMESKGFIVRNGQAGQTERHWTGARVKVVTVSEGPALKHWGQHFTYNGVEYRIKYFDGCFKPFVVRVGVPLPSFV